MLTVAVGPGGPGGAGGGRGLAAAAAAAAAAQQLLVPEDARGGAGPERGGQGRQADVQVRPLLRHYLHKRTGTIRFNRICTRYPGQLGSAAI